MSSSQSTGKTTPAVMDYFQLHTPTSEESLHQLAELDVVIDKQNCDTCLGCTLAWIRIVDGGHGRAPPCKAKIPDPLVLGVGAWSSALPGVEHWPYNRLESPRKVVHWGSTEPG